MNNELGSPGKDVESEVWNAIAAFEQILEAMPNDRVALETLFQAYEQIGDASRSLEYLCRLGDSIADEADVHAAQDLVEKVQAHAHESDAAGAVAERLSQLIANPQLQTETEAAPHDEDPRPKSITSEMSLAWNLLQAGELTEDEYSSIVQDLTECLSRDMEVPVSVVHVLHDREFRNYEKILAFISKDSGTPLISMSNFDLSPDVYNVLPLNFMMHRGAIVFERMETDLLVAVLNPYNKELQQAVRSITGCNCHFYQVAPEDYDSSLEDIRKVAELVQDQG
jgi:hypothetical protein